MKATRGQANGKAVAAELRSPAGLTRRPPRRCAADRPGRARQGVGDQSGLGEQVGRPRAAARSQVGPGRAEPEPGDVDRPRRDVRVRGQRPPRAVEQPDAGGVVEHRGLARALALEVRGEQGRRASRPRHGPGRPGAPGRADGVGGLVVPVARVDEPVGAVRPRPCRGPRRWCPARPRRATAGATGCRAAASRRLRGAATTSGGRVGTADVLVGLPQHPRRAVGSTKTRGSMSPPWSSWQMKGVGRAVNGPVGEDGEGAADALGLGACDRPPWR